MDFRNFPLRKEYIFKVGLEGALLPLFNRTITIKFKQASIGEYIDYLQDNKKIQWMQDFLKNHSNAREKDISRIISKHGDFLDVILEKFLNGDSKYKPLHFNPSPKYHTPDAPDSYSLVCVCDVLGEPLQRVLKHYTFEQYTYILEGKVWQANETNDKGKMENKLASEKRKLGIN